MMVGGILAAVDSAMKLRAQPADLVSPPTLNADVQGEHESWSLSRLSRDGISVSAKSHPNRICMASSKYSYDNYFAGSNPA